MCPPARYARNLQLARRYAPFCGRATRAIPPARYARPNCASRRHAIPCTAQMFTVVGISWLHVASRDQTPKPPSNPIRRFGLDQLSMVIPCRCTAMAMTLAYVAASRRSRLLAYLGSMLLSETKVTQQSHQEVWFGSAEHGSMRLQRHWSWLQLIKCFNVGREVRTRLCTIDLPIRSPNDLSRWRMDFRRTSSNTVSRWSWCAAGRPLRGPYAARGGPLRGPWRAATRPGR